jgi:phenylalanyl-tRNA synthetase beta chain
VIDVHPTPRAPRRLSVRLARAARLLGYAPRPEEAHEALALLSLAPRGTSDGFEVTVPSWRVDLEREEDVIEEIGRHLGYDRIPSRVPEAARRRAVSGGSSLDERVRDRFSALGFSEAFTYAMVPAGGDASFVGPEAPPALTLANPLAETLADLRRAIAPGLLRAAGQNLRRGVADVRLFEVGHVFLARGQRELPDEPAHAAFAWSGTARPRHWSEPARAADFHDAAGLVEDLLALAGAEGALAKRPGGPAGLHPGRSCTWHDRTGRSVAWCGSVHPDVAARWDLPADVLLGEIDLTSADGTAGPAEGYRAVPRVPGLFRDLSIVLDRDAAAGSVVAALAAVASPAPASFAWIDRYEGAPLPAGQAAMTLRVILQPQDRTLTDAEAEAYRARLIEALDAVPGARLRRIDT